ncbi:hypothetical protein [Pseudomonas faucium]|uniref:hypothetical protein n=1 Tax=Pseudomonas faucium TaxID=2740518 RepID=UPI001596A068|nr:hypothetical protein [Pseudomonas faucium]
MQALLDFDARKLSEAIKYQIHVAIEHCHTLDDDESLWIEVFGDVTTGIRDQIEVKMHSDSLTDGHPNFWNTLYNWLKPEFDHTRFQRLVLLTTQKFGAQSNLARWNDLTLSSRVELLVDICAQIDKRKPKRGRPKSGTEGARQVLSKSATQRQHIMSDGMREILLKAVPKIILITEHDDLLGLIARYAKEKLRHINPANVKDFCNDMFGFMTDAEKIGAGWEIKGREFSAKYSELSKRYMSGSLLFPRIDTEQIKTAARTSSFSDRRFTTKLSEIGADQHALNAAVLLLSAEAYMAAVLEDFTANKEDIEIYQNHHSELHHWRRLEAMDDCEDDYNHSQLSKASRKFFAKQCGADVVKLATYVDTPPEFRNGIYHILADEPYGLREHDFHWRLWEK